MPLLWTEYTDALPPWAGRSRLARRLTTIVPITTLAEALETTRLHHVAGLTGAHTTLVTARPFRGPRHTILDVGLIGGGQMPMPGEVSLAHHGVLFLDEWPEFRRHEIEALQHAECRDDQIFRDVASGAHTARPGPEACVHALAPGDTWVVWRLDRLGRSVVHLVMVIEELLRRQVGSRSLCDRAIDTTTASGELVFHLFSALAQFERRLIQERTQAGLATARARGERGGRRSLRPDDPACAWRP